MAGILNIMNGRPAEGDVENMNSGFNDTLEQLVSKQADSLSKLIVRCNMHG